MLFNLYLPETTSQLSRKLKLQAQTKSCDTLRSSDLPYHDLDAASIVYSYTTVNPADQTHVKSTASRRRNQSRSQGDGPIGVAEDSVASKRERRKNQSSSDIPKSETVKMSSNGKQRPRQATDNPKLPQRAETTRERRRQSVLVETAPMGKPTSDRPNRHSSVFKDIFTRRRNDAPPNRAETTPRRQDSSKPPQPRHDRRSSMYLPTTENSYSTTRPVSMASTARAHLPSRDNPRVASPIPVPRTPTRQPSSSTPRPSTRPCSMIPDDAFANEAEFQLFANATAGLGGFDGGGFGPSPSNGVSANFPSPSRHRRPTTDNADPIPEDPSDHRRSNPGEAIPSSEYTPTTRSALQQLAQMPQARTPRQARPASRPASTVYYSGAAVSDVGSWVDSVRSSAGQPSVAERRSIRARPALAQCRIDRPRPFLYMNGEEEEYRTAEEEEAQINNGHDLGPDDDGFAFNNDDELPDYAQSQEEAEAHLKAYRMRRAQELSREWQLSGSRRGGV